MANFRKLGTDFTDGLQTPHYTNGRLLTAEDLQREQQSVLERLAQLGKGFAAGVIEGFRVSALAGNTSLQVTAGSGINRKGNVVKLFAKTVTLPVQPIPVGGSDAIRRSGRFEGCDGDASQPGSAPVTTGAYLLTVAPLARLEGAVPRQAISGTETATCANQWEVEGVEFKMIRLDDYQRPTGSRRQRNRNLLAHWFYGSSKLTRLMLELFHFDPNYSGFAALPPDDYTPCDLPLAVFFWENSRIAFVDEWAARRRVSHPYPASDWTANVSERRAAEGEARFLQFQEQLDDLRSSAGSKASSVRATEHFAFLPPVGFLPVNPFELIVDDIFDQAFTDNHQERIDEAGLSKSQVRERVRAAVMSSLGSNNLFRLDRFFEDLLPPHYHIVHEDEVHDRLQLSWMQPPITLPAPPADSIVAQPGYFELLLPDDNVLAVTDNNLNAVFAELAPSSGLMLNVASAEQPVEAAAPAPGTNTLNLLRDSGIPSGFATHNVRRNAPLFNMFDAFVHIPDDAKQQEPEPLVDILVVDELLAPYRMYLTGQMPGRIDSAITSLVSGGSVFAGGNIFASVNNTIYNTFMLNNFMETAIHTGIADLARLDRFAVNDPLPPFYVVFVRHRPTRRIRPLRSG